MRAGELMTTTAAITTEQIWGWLEEIADPEIPVISITDLGIVRSVSLDPESPASCTIGITPTYSGCPATDMIAAQIRQKLADHGLREVALCVQLAPAWSTGWLTERGREALRRYGIAPPSGTGPALTQIWVAAAPEVIACPQCGSTETEVLSQFGSTPCKSLHRCRRCREPFDYFKPH